MNNRRDSNDNQETHESMVNESRLKGYVVAIDAFENPTGLTLLDMVRFVWEWKVFLFAATIVGVIIAGSATFFADRYYQAEVVVVSTDRNRGRLGLNSLMEQFGGLAANVGISIEGDAAKTEALAILNSRVFTRAFISERELVPILFHEQWDEGSDDWRSHVKEDPPSLQDAVILFDDEVRDVSEDTRTGLISLTITWIDPGLAANWANEMISEVNDLIRHRRVAEATSSIEYLTLELENESELELRQAIFRTMEAQLRTIMIANVRPDYAFRVIDPATPPEPDDFIYPNLAFALISGAVLGGIFGLVVAAIRPIHFFRRS